MEGAGSFKGVEMKPPSFIYAFLVLLLLTKDVFAQNELSGSFETNTIYYLNDKASGAIAPENKLGSNNYLKLDYRYKKFKAGVQFESYLPVLQGLPGNLYGSGLMIKYASFQDSNLTVTAGDFYEQLGNGLIFRAFEERALGLNTALEGVRVTYNFRDYLLIKALAGRPREFMNKANSNVKGASILLNLNPLLQLEKSSANLELNVINRYLSYAGQEPINPNVDAWSLTGSWSRGGISLQGEYAYKTKDRSAYTNNRSKDGSALLLELGFNSKGLGTLLTFRRLEYMQFGTTRGGAGIGRDLNFLPALTKQHNYSLAVLNPHNTVGNEEIGGQLDIHYRFKKNSWLGGKYGIRISLNAAGYFGLQGDAEKGFDFFAFGNRKYYHDFNLSLEKRLSPDVITHLLLSNQVFNPVVIGKENDLYTSRIIAGDIILKTAPQKSFRFEWQHLWSEDYLKNWAAATVEYSISPTWTYFIGDMYNYGVSNVHYYRIGSSYNISRTRMALNFGRNREGIICTGGICLYMPAYTGANLSVTTSF